MMRYAWIEEPPFNFATAAESDGVPDGVDVAVILALAAQLGETVEFRRTEFSDLLPGLARGDWDVTAAMFLTPEREARAFFTRPVWRLADGLLLRGELAGQVTGYRSLAERGLRLAVLEGQVQERTALDCGVEPGRITIFPDYASAAEAVLSDEVDAYASVALAHRATVSRHRGLCAVTVPEVERPRSPGAFACATPALRARLDSALAGLLVGDDHASTLRRYGLGSDEAPACTTSLAPAGSSPL